MNKTVELYRDFVTFVSPKLGKSEEAFIALVCGANLPHMFLSVAEARQDDMSFQMQRTETRYEVYCKQSVAFAFTAIDGKVVRLEFYPESVYIGTTGE